ncbi:hypothetical protein NDU88_000972 [Pleurodeles waltl]|uniref:Secreted protein n=1 Tax=Pleurodeles waltl TaxID=8319 RepID=A0AAV7LB83_PLEWA|nr:hypothetical protein NDU88_000972 [Pleurodeles waltl]
MVVWVWCACCPIETAASHGRPRGLRQEMGESAQPGGYVKHWQESGGARVHSEGAWGAPTMTRRYHTAPIFHHNGADRRDVKFQDLGNGAAV